MLFEDFLTPPENVFYCPGTTQSSTDGNVIDIREWTEMHPENQCTIALSQSQTFSEAKASSSHVVQLARVTQGSKDYSASIIVVILHICRGLIWCRCSD